MDNENISDENIDRGTDWCPENETSVYHWEGNSRLFTMDNENISDETIEKVTDWFPENETSVYYWEGAETSPAFFNFAKYLTVYFQPFLFGFGLIGNLLSFVIFMSKPMRKISSNIYLAALSGSSLGFNLVLLLQWLEMVHIPIIHMQGVCQTIVYFAYVFGFLSVWFIVCITVENYIVTFHLSRAVIYCTVFRAKLVVTMLVMYAVILYCGQFWTTSVVDVGYNVSICTEVAAYSKLNKIYSFWDTITTLVVPTIITSVLIVAILYKNVCLRRQRSMPENPISRRLSKKQKSLVRITRVLLAISLTFVILSCPSHANKLRHLIVRELEGIQIYTLYDRLLQQIFQIVYYISFCFNFVYYLMWSNNFRKECKRMFCCPPDARRRSFRDFEVRNRVDLGTNGINITTGYVEKSTNFTEKITML